MNWPDIVAVAVTLFFVMDPIGNMPAFNALLSRFDTRRRARITARELVIALGILLVFLFHAVKYMDTGSLLPDLYLQNTCKFAAQAVRAGSSIPGDYLRNANPPQYTRFEFGCPGSMRLILCLSRPHSRRMVQSACS